MKLEEDPGPAAPTGIKTEPAALLEVGADPTIKTNAGYHPIDFAHHSAVMKDMLVKASIEFKG